MSDQQQLKQPRRQSSITSPINNNQAEEQISEIQSSNYCSFFNIQSAQSIQDIKRSVIKLISPIEIDEEQQEYSTIFVKAVNHSAHYEFIEIEVRIGNLHFPNMTIAFFETQSPTHKCQTWKSGGFSKVYFCSYSEKNIAIKCCKRQIGQKLLTQNLDRIITEYCLQKLAAAMGVAPKVQNQLGYQIAIYSTCIQFAMQICSQIQSSPKDILQIRQQLKQNLLKMHSLQFVHLDIKYQNIMFSPSMNKYVLSDFGFSLILQQPMGMKTKTQFRGSLTSCSKEMLKLYSSDNPMGQIDLYANDLQCLQKTMEEIRQQITEQGKSIVEEQNQYYHDNIRYDISQWHRLHLLKYYCFMRMLQSLQQALFSNFTDLQWRQLLQFVNGLWNKKEVFAYLLLKCASILPKQFKLIPNNTDQSSAIHIFNLRSIIYINRHTKYFLLQQLVSDPQQVYRIIITQTQERILSIDTYLLVISKAIDLSTRTLQIKQIIDICMAAKDLLRIHEVINAQVMPQAVAIGEVSLYIFKLSLSKKLDSFYGNLFINSINNVFFLNLLNPQEIIETLQKLIQLKLKFTQRAMIFLSFCAALRIHLYQSEDLSICPNIFIQISSQLQQYYTNQICSQYKKDSKQRTTFLVLLLHVFQRQNMLDEVNLNLIDKSLIKDLSLYYMPSLSFYSEDVYYNQISMLVQYKQNIQKVKFGYYHYFIMQNYFKQQGIFTAVHSLIQKHKDVVRVNKTNRWEQIAAIYQQLISSQLSFNSCKRYMDYLISFKDTIPLCFKMLLRFIAPIIQKFQYHQNLIQQFKLYQFQQQIQTWTSTYYKSTKKPQDYLKSIATLQQFILVKYVAKFIIFYRFTYFTRKQLEKFSQIYRLSIQYQLQQIHRRKLAKWFFLNMVLVIIFVLSNKIYKAFGLFRKMFLIAKALNINEIFEMMGDTLKINFWLQRQTFRYVKKRFIEFKDYYLLYYDYLSRSNQLDNVLGSQFLIEGLLYSFYRYSPTKLLEFTRFLMYSLRKIQSGNLALSVIHIYQRLFIERDVWQYIDSHRLLIQELTVQQNPFNIIPLFLTYLNTTLSSLSYIYRCFYKASPFVPILVRQYILLYIHLAQQNRLGKSRHVKLLDKINSYHGFYETTPETISNIVKKSNIRNLKKKSKKAIKQYHIYQKLQRLIVNVRYKNSISILKINTKLIKLDIRPLKMNLLLPIQHQKKIDSQ